MNPARGEAALMVEVEARVMRLTLGALAELEEALQCRSLATLAERFETGSFTARDLICLLGAGLRGAGAAISDDVVAGLPIDGGAAGAAQAAARLLHAAFAPLDP